MSLDSGADDVIEVERGSKGTSWWVFALIGVDVAVAAVCAFFVIKTFFLKKKPSDSGAI